LAVRTPCGLAGALALAVPPVLQLEGPVAERGAGDQVERPVLADVVEQPPALARHIGLQAQVEHVDQVEPHGDCQKLKPP
jgi:hypothetical protein